MSTKEDPLQSNVRRWREKHVKPPAPTPPAGVLPKFRRLEEYIKDGKPSWLVVPGGASANGK